MADSISILEQIMRQATARHNVIASNIANVDTPGYKAKEVNFGNILGNELGMTITNRQHLPAAEGAGAGETKTDDTQPWLDKNNVEMDVEVAKMTENAMRFEAGVTLLEKKIQMYKNALRTT